MKTPRRTTKKQKTLAAAKDSIAITQQNLAVKRVMQALLPEVLVDPNEESPPAWVIRLGKKLRLALGIEDLQATDAESEGKLTAAMLSITGFLGSADPKHLPSGLTKSKMKPFQQVTQTLAREEVSNNTSMSADHQAKFFGGFSKSINGTVEPSGFPAKRNARYELDLTLVMLWAIGLRFKTSTELYRFLSGPSGTDNARLGDLDSFQRYIRGHGVRLGTRGKQSK